MDNLDLDDRYRGYLTCLNERRLDDLPEFVHNPVVHNERTLSITAFQDLLRRDATEIPDLYYTIELLVVQHNRVACRIRFDCTPTTTFRGIPPTGRPISFVEHVFYRFQDNKIARIWSLIDMDAIREQLTADT